MAVSFAERLARNIEKSVESSRALDAAICRMIACALGARRKDYWYDFFGIFMSDHTTPKLTESVDASLKLLDQALPGWFGDVDFGASIAKDGTFGARIFPPGEKNHRNFPGEAKTPALALSAALVRAWSYKTDTDLV